MHSNDIIYITVSIYKPLLRDSVMFSNGTYIDSVFKKLDMTPLIDDIEYNLDLSCKISLEKNQSFEVMGMDPQEQMCMYEMSGVSVDLFTFIRQLTAFSLSLDVCWLSDDVIQITNENIEIISSYLSMTSLDMYLIDFDENCTELKYGPSYDNSFSSLVISFCISINIS